MADTLADERHGEAVLRAAVAGYLRYLAEFRPPARGRALKNLRLAEGILAQALIYAHGLAHDETPKEVIAAEVDGLLVVHDPGDPIDEGLRIHVVEVGAVLRFGRQAGEAPDAPGQS